MKIPAKAYESIAEYIQSADSPVGIDAKKTHVYIIHTLHDIQKRLAVLEQQSAAPREAAVDRSPRSKPAARKTAKTKRKPAQQ